MNPVKKILIEASKEIKIIDSYDVAIVGGGVAGISAAVAATREGAKVCIIEKENGLGGLSTLGLILYYLPLCDGNGNQMIGGLGEELLYLSLKYGPGLVPDVWKKKLDPEIRSKERYRSEFNPASFCLAIEELVLQYNIKLFYDSKLCNVIVKNNEIKALIIENKSGRLAIGAKTIIDATGDADVCNYAGEETNVFDTNTEIGWFLGFNGNKVNLEIVGNDEHIQGEIKTGYSLEVKNGIKTYSGIYHEDITALNIANRKLILKKVKELRKINPDFYPVTISSIPQFRLTRVLKGQYVFGEKDERKYFNDCIGMSGDWRKSGPRYFLPYRSLIGKKIVNLITAGRCISTTSGGSQITRIIPTCALTGQAAGVACVLSIKTNSNLFNISINSLQKLLKKQGVLINKNLAS